MHCAGLQARAHQPAARQRHGTHLSQRPKGRSTALCACAVEERAAPSDDASGTSHSSRAGAPWRAAGGADALSAAGAGAGAPAGQGVAFSDAQLRGLVAQFQGPSGQWDFDALDEPSEGGAPLFGDSEVVDDGVLRDEEGFAFLDGEFQDPAAAAADATEAQARLLRMSAAESAASQTAVTDSPARSWIVPSTAARTARDAAIPDTAAAQPPDDADAHVPAAADAKASARIQVDVASPANAVAPAATGAEASAANSVAAASATSSDAAATSPRSAEAAVAPDAPATGPSDAAADAAPRRRGVWGHAGAGAAAMPRRGASASSSAPIQGRAAPYRAAAAAGSDASQPGSAALRSRNLELLPGLALPEPWPEHRGQKYPAHLDAMMATTKFRERFELFLEQLTDWGYFKTLQSGKRTVPNKNAINNFARANPDLLHHLPVRNLHIFAKKFKVFRLRDLDRKVGGPTCFDRFMCMLASWSASACLVHVLLRSRHCWHRTMRVCCVASSRPVHLHLSQMLFAPRCKMCCNELHCMRTGCRVRCAALDALVPTHDPFALYRAACVQVRAASGRLMHLYDNFTLQPSHNGDPVFQDVTRLILFIAQSDFPSIEAKAPGIVAAACELLVDVTVAAVLPPELKTEKARRAHSADWYQLRETVEAQREDAARRLTERRDAKRAARADYRCGHLPDRFSLRVNLQNQRDASDHCR